MLSTVARCRRFAAVSSITITKPQLRRMGSISAFDSIIFRNLFGTEDIRNIFSDEAYIRRCVDVETALARAQAHCSVIPAQAGDQISSQADASALDLERMRTETEIVGYPILPLVRKLSAMCGPSGKFIHWGATTQDIMDTASVLQMRYGLGMVDTTLCGVISALEHLALAHRDTPMAGRTHLQHALPLTFGYKCAVWLSGLYRHRGRLEQLRPRVLMSSNELGEVAEPFVPHRGASSTMPQKRNPISSEVILVASKVLRSNAGLVLDGMVSDFERASGPWHLEWVAIPESFVMAVGALHQAEFVLSGLEVHKVQMADNLAMSKGLIVAEAVMMSFANYIGRQMAHDVVYDACKKTIESRGQSTLLDTLKESETVLKVINMKELERLCDPASYLGSSQQMVEDTLKLRRG